MAGREPEYRVERPLVRQDWRTMTFVHWRYDPALIQALLPDDLEVHVRDGAAWVSLTPFVLARFRPPVGPPVPLLSTFPETNLRTYAIGPDGRDGIYFLDVEAASAPTTLALRVLLDLPYHRAAMRVDVQPTVRYRSDRRTSAGSVGYDMRVEIGEPLPVQGQDSLDQWLAGRWRAYGRLFGHRVAVPVEHQPWQLFKATLLDPPGNLLASAHLPEPPDAPIVRYSPGVSVALGVPRRLHPVSPR
jgi:uncharacterized protein YqjF (DUF2071 family)